MSERVDSLNKWLASELKIDNPQVTAITNDASFRRYFRITIDGVPHIVMDAPPSKEDCRPFINIAERLKTIGLNVPHIIASDLDQGFLLLTDLGSELYLPALNEQRVDQLYGDALEALAHMQTHANSDDLPVYNRQLLHREMNLFIEWLLNKHLNLVLSDTEHKELENCLDLLSDCALSQPQVFVHRDYHSRNLMICNSKSPGILDFQDAVKGPITYDLVSLLKDCYITWSNDQTTTWAIEHYTRLQQNGLLNDIDEKEFLRWFHWMGIQRHLKASGIFARLYHRDGKSGYLKDIPRTVNYIVNISAEYPELAALHKLSKAITHRRI
jgi:aminoglycoside/choline kinase family phosphotransferase